MGSWRDGASGTQVYKRHRLQEPVCMVEEAETQQGQPCGPAKSEGLRPGSLAGCAPGTGGGNVPAQAESPLPCSPFCPLRPSMDGTGPTCLGDGHLPSALWLRCSSPPEAPHSLERTFGWLSGHHLGMPCPSQQTLNPSHYGFVVPGSVYRGTGQVVSAAGQKSPTVQLSKHTTKHFSC